MKLYQIRYFGRSVDSNIPLPQVSHSKEVAYAHCSNEANEWLIPNGLGGWTVVTREQALGRAGIRA